MSADYICNTSVDIKWLEKTLLDGISAGKPPPNVALTSWSAEKVAQGMGFLSYIIKVNLSWSDSNVQGLPESVILKIPSMDSMVAFTDEVGPPGVKEALIPTTWATEAHSVECAFYDLWATEAAPCKVPRCFFVQPVGKYLSGLLVFEDLSTNGLMESLYTGLNLPQMLDITENLAKIQAWSLTHGGWHDKFPLQNKKNLEGFGPVMQKMFDDLNKDYPEMFPREFFDSFFIHCSSADDFYYAYTVHKEFNMTPVLVHGDLWINNLFLKKEIKNGKPTATNELLALIDWQIAHPGCAMEDFARCIWSSAQEDVRRNQLQKIFTHHYAKLKEFIGKDPPFTYDLLMRSWDRLVKYGMISATGPLLLMTKMDPTIAGDKQKLENVLRRTKNMIEDALVFLVN